MMKTMLSIVACIALLATLLPSILVYTGTIELGTHKTIMALGMVLWFAATPFIKKRRNSP
jgi:uncharacterized membrane protein YjjB (DUF3815 family)